MLSVSCCLSECIFFLLCLRDWPCELVMHPQKIYHHPASEKLNFIIERHPVKQTTGHQRPKKIYDVVREFFIILSIWKVLSKINLKVK